MNKLYPQTFLLLLVCLLASCTRPTLPTLLDRDSGFTFELPKGWSVDPDEKVDDERSSWVDGAERARIRVQLHSLTEGQRSGIKNLKKYAEAYKSFIQTDPGLKDVSVLEDKALTIDGKPAYEVIFVATTGPTPRWRRKVFIPDPADPGRLAEVTMEAVLTHENEYSVDFSRVVETWKWNERKPEEAKK